MKCLVCAATWDERSGGHCPQCGYDMTASGANDPAAVARAREEFRHRTTAYAPQTRVGRWDVARPWIGVGLGFLLFVVWMRACSTGGVFR